MRLVVGAVLCVIGCWRVAASATPSRLIEERTPLGGLDSRPVTSRIFVSPDANRAAWQRRVGDQVAMVVDGVAGKAFDSVDDPVFSPDCSRVLYIGHYGEQACLVLEGKVGELYRNVHDPKFSPDSRHVLYVGRTGVDEESLFIDDGRQGRYRFIHTPCFAPDSATVAYDATKGSEATHVLVQDGVESEQGGPITDLTFSPDGRHLAIVRHNDGLHEAVVVDGRPGQVYKKIGDLKFSGDSQHLAYTIWRDDKALAVLDGNEQKPRALVLRFDFSPRGARYMSVGLVGPGLQDGMIGVIDGSEFGPFADIGGAAFSHDGSRLAFRLRRSRGGPMTMWVDGVEQKPFAEVEPPVFSPDSRHLAYSVRFDAVKVVGNEAIVRDGTPGPAYDGAWDPTFSPDSKHLAYRAFRRGLPRDGHRVVLDGIEGRIYDQTAALVFSPDSQHCAYLAERDMKWFAVVDDNETDPADGVLQSLAPKLVFDAPDRFHFLAIQSGKLTRVSVRIAPK